MGLLEPTNLLLLACALIYGLIGEPVDGAILLVLSGPSPCSMPCNNSAATGPWPNWRPC